MSGIGFLREIRGCVEMKFEIYRHLYFVANPLFLATFFD